MKQEKFKKALDNAFNVITPAFLVEQGGITIQLAHTIMIKWNTPQSRANEAHIIIEGFNLFKRQIEVFELDELEQYTLLYWFAGCLTEDMPEINASFYKWMKTRLKMHAKFVNQL